MAETLEVAEDLVLNTYKRTHRWDRVRRDEDAVAQSKSVAKVTSALFSTALVDIDLYNKPLAHNCPALDARRRTPAQRLYSHTRGDSTGG